MLESYLKDLAELVNRDCGTHNCAGVTGAAEIMKRHFESIGFHAELVDLGPKAGRGLFATNRPGADHYDVMMNAHLDTVFSDGTSAERPMSREGDHVKGPGCSDCKSGVLAIFYALKNARKEDLERLSVAVCLNPDEETGSASSHQWLSETAAKSTRALVFEAARAGGELVRARKGRAAYHVVMHGVSAHAGNNPQDGRSAVLAACRFALAADKLQDLKGAGTSVNVIIKKGGTVSNVVPDICELEFDTRFWTNEERERLDKNFAALCEGDWGEGTRAELVKLAYLPAMPCTEKTRELVSQIEEAARLEGVKIGWVDAGGGSDANHIALAGTPVIDGVGPAGAGFHTDREYLRVDTVEERIRMIVRFLSLI